MKESLFSVVVLFLSVVLILGFAFTTIAGRTAGVAIDDATITTKVKYELADDVKFSTLKTIQVDTDRGEVTLTGKVNTQEQKEHAGLVADKVSGVVMVHNMLSVVPEQ
jgi:hyperosmotically inducible periplasmic protein